MIEEPSEPFRSVSRTGRQAPQLACHEPVSPFTVLLPRSRAAGPIKILRDSSCPWRFLRPLSASFYIPFTILHARPAEKSHVFLPIFLFVVFGVSLYRDRIRSASELAIVSFPLLPFLRVYSVLSAGAFWRGSRDFGDRFFGTALVNERSISSPSLNLPAFLESV